MLLANSIVNPGMTVSDGDFKKTEKSSEVEPPRLLSLKQVQARGSFTLCRKRPDSWHFTSVRPSEPGTKGPIYPASPVTSLSGLLVAVLGLKSIIFLAQGTPILYLFNRKIPAVSEVQASLPGNQLERTSVSCVALHPGANPNLLPKPYFASLQALSTTHGSLSHKIPPCTRSPRSEDRFIFILTSIITTIASGSMRQMIMDL